MTFDFAAHKARTRQMLHSIMAVSAFYTDIQTPQTAEPNVTVRWHNKLVTNGASQDGFDAQIIEGVNRLVFQSDQLTLAGVTLRGKGLVYIPGYNAIFKLITQEPQDGPLNVYWNVTYQGDS